MYASHFYIFYVLYFVYASLFVYCLFFCYSQSIELELRKYEVQEANEHVKMLTCYLPDYFSRRGGE